MLLKRFFSFALVMATATILCAAQMPDSVITGAEQLNVYLPKLRNQKVAVVANQTSIVGNEHLIDVLLQLPIKRYEMQNLQ